MAWIKFRTNLLTDPAVYKMSALLGIDRFAVLGRLAAFWGWADEHAVDGYVDGATSTAIDDVVALGGFADALVKAKWLSLTDDGAQIPNHERHNGATAKERALKSERQSKWRKGQSDQPLAGDEPPSISPSKPVDGNVDGGASTREEKRRGDKKTPNAPKGAAVGAEVPDWIPGEPWGEFVAMRRAKGQRTPFTVGAAKGVIAKLETFRDAGHDLADVLRQSTVNGWADVYEPKGKPGGAGIGNFI